jgi:hypothetical protein
VGIIGHDLQFLSFGGLMKIEWLPDGSNVVVTCGYTENGYNSPTFSSANPINEHKGIEDNNQRLS